MKTFHNTFNKPAETPEPEKKAPVKSNSAGGTFKSIIDGTILERKIIISLLPFFLFVTCLGLLLIFNSNYANRTVIGINITKKQIIEQRFEYINVERKLMLATRQSEVAKRLVNSGLKESKVPPRKIILVNTQNK